MIEVIESAGNGAYTTMPEPGDVPASAPVAPHHPAGLGHGIHATPTHAAGADAYRQWRVC